MREYVVIYKTPSGTHKTTHQTMFLAMHAMLYYLDSIKALNNAEKGRFITTQNPFTKESVTKRYEVDVVIPKTKITIKKRSKGSINTENFMGGLNYIKRYYYERN